MAEAGNTVDNQDTVRGLSDEEFEEYLDALDESPKGQDMQVKDWTVLAVTGVVIPLSLLIWGWL